MYTLQRIADLNARYARGLLERQVIGGEHDGAIVQPAYGVPLPDAGHGRHVADLAYAWLVEGTPLAGDPGLLHRTLRAIRYMRTGQRPSGLLDLAEVNIDSAPCTAFVIELLCPVYELAQARAGDDGAAALADALREFLVPASRGVIHRGFHTPNHRWVVCSALLGARDLWESLAPGDTRTPGQMLAYVEAILAEGIDCDADGMYTERSPGVYDAVCDRAMRVCADRLQRPELLEPVRRNLDLIAHLLHPDGTVETGMSTRQDRGRDVVPVTLADSFHDMARRDGNGAWATLADRLVQHAERTGEHSTWLIHPLLFPSPGADPQPAAPPEDFARLFAAAGVWRLRRGELSATATRGIRQALSLRWGPLRLRTLRPFGAYITKATFVADEVAAVPGGVRLVHHGQPPRYFLPVGRAVDTSDWEVSRELRPQYRLEPMTTLLDVTEAEGGLDVRVQTRGGLDKALFQLELAFDGPGLWRTAGQSVEVANGQTALLHEGWGEFVRDGRALRVGPGAGAHAFRRMRDSEPLDSCFRVVIPLLTPVDHTLHLRPGGRSWQVG